jgi:CheY-like chemotaxis protein
MKLKIFRSAKNGRTMNSRSSDPDGNPSGASAASPTRKVLVVDDSRDARSILKLLLTKLGHETRTAEDGQTGIAISKDFQPDIVLCDLMMGGMSGYAFAKAARAEGALEGMCIIAVSGLDGSDYEQQAYAAGFDRLMKKPLGLSELQAILQSPPRRSDAGRSNSAN